MKSSVLALCGVLVWSGGSFADSEGDRPALVRVPVKESYIPTGFDSNDRALLVIGGEFSSTCYRIGPQDVKIDEDAKKITITQGAYKYNGPCLTMMVEFSQTVQLGLLKAGNYAVIDGATKDSLGTLPIAKATNEGPDDFLYAQVKDSYVSLAENDQWVVVLKLQMPGNCWVLDEKRVLKEGKNVITVLPIIVRRSDDRCDETGFPYSTSVKLPSMEAGRYLLHVRSLEGQAVTKLFDID